MKEVITDNTDIQKFISDRVRNNSAQLLKSYQSLW